MAAPAAGAAPLPLPGRGQPLPQPLPLPLPQPGRGQPQPQPQPQPVRRQPPLLPALPLRPPPQPVQQPQHSPLPVPPPPQAEPPPPGRYEPYPPVEHDLLWLQLVKRERLLDELKELERECERLHHARNAARAAAEECMERRALFVTSREEMGTALRSATDQALDRLVTELHRLNAAARARRDEWREADARRVAQFTALLEAQEEYWQLLGRSGGRRPGDLQKLCRGTGYEGDPEMLEWRTLAPAPFSFLLRTTFKIPPTDIRLTSPVVFQEAQFFTDQAWDVLNAFDPCPAPQVLQAKYGPDFDGLTADWRKYSACYGCRAFLNPPFANTIAWMRKACYEVLRGTRVLALVRHRPDHIKPSTSIGGDWSRYNAWMYNIFDHSRGFDVFVGPLGERSSINYRLIDMTTARAVMDPRVERFARSGPETHFEPLPKEVPPPPPPPAAAAPGAAAAAGAGAESAAAGGDCAGGSDSDGTSESADSTTESSAPIALPAPPPTDLPDPVVGDGWYEL